MTLTQEKKMAQGGEAKGDLWQKLSSCELRGAFRARKTGPCCGGRGNDLDGEKKKAPPSTLRARTQTSKKKTFRREISPAACEASFRLELAARAITGKKSQPCPRVLDSFGVSSQLKTSGQGQRSITPPKGGEGLVSAGKKTSFRSY